MSLNTFILKNKLISIFSNMTTGSNEYFAEELAKAIAEYIETGIVTTVDAGTISTGAFTGGGDGSIAVSFTSLQTTLLAACTAMGSMVEGGNTYVATQIATGVHTMVSAGEVTTNVTGTVVTPSGVTSALTGTAKGTLSGQPLTIQTSLVTAFTAMEIMTEGGIDYISEQITSSITKYLKEAAVSTTGQTVLSGSSGTGAIT